MVIAAMILVVQNRIKLRAHSLQNKATNRRVSNTEINRRVRFRTFVQKEPLDCMLYRTALNCEHRLAEQTFRV